MTIRGGGRGGPRLRLTVMGRAPRSDTKPKRHHLALKDESSRKKKEKKKRKDAPRSSSREDDRKGREGE